MNCTYPKILVEKTPNNYILHTSIIRIKRKGVWYDVLVKEIYTEKSIDKFKDRLIMAKLYWENTDEGHKFYIPPSKDQNNIKDDLLDDKGRVERIKRTQELFS